MNESESFGPDPVLIGFWILLAGIPVPIAIYDLIKLGFHTTGGLLVASVVGPIAVLVFSLRFRVTFAPDSFIYRRWGPTIRVAYKDIAELEIANVTPLTQQAIGAFIITRSGERLPFWPKLFPRRAVDRFFALAPQPS